MPYIQVNRPYPKGKYKVDIFVKIPKSKLPPEIVYRWANSGVCEENWIEVKFFGGAERKKGSEPKTQNLGKILEALRLKFYVRHGGKYLLMVFNRMPSYYIPRRGYVSQILKHGRRSLEIDFLEEPETVIRSIHDENLRKLIENAKKIRFDLQKLFD